MKRRTKNQTEEPAIIQSDIVSDLFREQSRDRAEAADTLRLSDDDSPLANYSLPNPFFPGIGG